MAHQQARKYTDLPVKLRRRQSDAKWRANVASCYETLKLIIPVNKRASKRQISRAHILQETEKHIQFLEDILSSLLLEKAQKDKVKDATGWKEKQIKQIKEQFVKIHHQKINHLNMEKQYKKKSYKLFIPNELMYQDLQQTAQLRTALIQKRETMMSALQDKEKGTGSKKSKSQRRRPKSVSNLANAKNSDDRDKARTAVPNLNKAYHIQPMNLYGSPPVVSMSSDINNSTLHTIIQQSGACHYGGGCVVIPSSTLPTTTPLLSAKDTSMFTKASSGKSSTVSVYSDIQEVPDLDKEKPKFVKHDRPRTNNVQQTKLVSGGHKGENEQVVPMQPKKVITVFKSKGTNPSCIESALVTKSPVKRPSELDVTPKKLLKKENIQGFTPVKLPNNWPSCSYITSPVSSRNHDQTETPIKPSPLQLSPNQTLPNTPDSFSLLEPLDSDEEGLLCTEEMWLSEEENDDMFPSRLETPTRKLVPGTELQNMKKARLDRSFSERFESFSSQVSSCSSTETKERSDDTRHEKKKYKNHIRTAKCRRSLQSLYDKSFDDTTAVHVETTAVENAKKDDITSGVTKSDVSDKDNETDDFDAYLQFYKNVSEQLTEKGGVDRHKMIYEAWKKNKQMTSKEKCEAPSKKPTQNSGFINSPGGVPEWTDIDSGVWPLQSDVDINATDEHNILDMESDVWEPLSLDSEGNIQDAVVPLSSTDCVQIESEMSVPNLSNDNNRQFLSNTVEKTLSSEANCISPRWNITFENYTNGDIDDSIDIVKPLFVLDKDIWLQCEPPGSVDEELHKYLADFSPPSKKNLMV